MNVPSLVTAAVIAGAALQARSVGDGVYTAAQASRGDRLYATYCANCHGIDLSGGDLAPALAGSEFLANWSGSTVGELFERIKKTMPQDSPDSLSRQQYADIVAFILSTAEFPAGASELPTAAETLAAIQFRTSQP